MMKCSFVKGMGPQTVLGLPKHDWEMLHLYVGLAMLVTVAFHLFSNRAWIAKVGAKNKNFLGASVARTWHRHNISAGISSNYFCKVICPGLSIQLEYGVEIRMCCRIWRSFSMLSPCLQNYFCAN